MDDSLGAVAACGLEYICFAVILRSHFWYDMYMIFLCLQSSPPLIDTDSTPEPASQLSDVLMKPPSVLMNDPLFEPIVSQTDDKPVDEAISKPFDDFVDLINNVEVETTSPAVGEISLDEPSDDFVDILGSETRKEEVVVAHVTVEAAAAESKVPSGVTEPFTDGKTGNDAGLEAEESSAAPIIDLSGDLLSNDAQQQPISDKIVNPLVDLLSNAPPAAEAKKPSVATIDLFEDEGSDLFAEPQQTKSAKQPQKSLFGEPDEDLFGEPLGAISKKNTSKAQKEKSDITKAAAAAAAEGPRPASKPLEPADIFTEEAVTAAPSISTTSTVNSKTNGVHSEADTDLFAGESTIFS